MGGSSAGVSCLSVFFCRESTEWNRLRQLIPARAVSGARLHDWLTFLEPGLHLTPSCWLLNPDADEAAALDCVSGLCLPSRDQTPPIPSPPEAQRAACCSIHPGLTSAFSFLASSLLLFIAVS